ncbi:hypothetical protein AHF37_10778 [Paragonimus kellicotti]|nr:hypothetical protein AHF37_10778 [Paragonimus kellicotti]
MWKWLCLIYADFDLGNKFGLALLQATSNELVNTVLRVAHLHLYRDLIRLYAVYNEAMINLIEIRYYHL